MKIKIRVKMIVDYNIQTRSNNMTSFPCIPNMYCNQHTLLNILLCYQDIENPENYYFTLAVAGVQKTWKLNISSFTITYSLQTTISNNSTNSYTWLDTETWREYLITSNLTNNTAIVPFPEKSFEELLSNYKNVFIHNGSSEKILDEILPNIDNRIMFFLDAHWNTYCPILDELEMIYKHKKNLKKIVSTLGPPF